MEQEVRFTDHLLGELKSRQKENRENVKELGDLMEYVALEDALDATTRTWMIKALANCHFQLRFLVEQIDEGIEHGEI